MEWVLQQKGYVAGAYADQGNRFLTGNGYLGVRGTLDEDKKEKLAAVNLAGVFDQVEGKVSEPLNAPNPFYTAVQIDGQILTVDSSQLCSHEVSLNYRHGIFARKTQWEMSAGNCIEIASGRFVCVNDKHISAVRYAVKAGAKGSELTLLAGIDGDVWDLNGPHYTEMSFAQNRDGVSCKAVAGSSHTVVSVQRRFATTLSQGATWEPSKTEGILQMKIHLQPYETVEVYSTQLVATSKDQDDTCFVTGNLWAMDAPDVLYSSLLHKQKENWERIWADCQVEIVGDEAAMQALNYSLYHLNSIAPEVGSAKSIGARGLSGQTYKGAVFWDTEMFIQDFFLYTRPQIARELVRYRIRTLEGAKEKAAHYGWKGAFYAWESQDQGKDACSEYNIVDVFTKRPMRTYFRDKQVHVSAAVAYAIWEYVSHTGDKTVLTEGGAETIFECALFYLSVLVQSIFVNDRYEIHDVVGPDEYHERINNDAYTNKMVQRTFEIALETAAWAQGEKTLWEQFSQKYDWKTFLPNLQKAKEKLFTGQTNQQGVIEQFTGYFKLADKSVEEVRAKLLDPKEYWGGAYGVASDTQVIKQADVIAMLEVFHDQYSSDTIKSNWEYYEPRTEHGSSLSYCMYALAACRFGEPDKAYPFFMKSASTEIEGGGKQWAGLLYIGGTHPAAAGGAWKAAVQGFAGLEIRDGVPIVADRMPSHWEKMSFPFVYCGKKFRTTVSREKCCVEPVATAE